MGASSVGGVGINRNSGRIAGYRSVTIVDREQLRWWTVQFTAQTAMGRSDGRGGGYIGIYTPQNQ